jgi:hypothetical protein
MPVQVEVGHGGPATTGVVEDAGLVGLLLECPVELAQQEVVRVLLIEVGLGVDVALGNEEIDEAVVVDVHRLGMPGSRPKHVSADERLGCGHAALEGDVADNSARISSRRRQGDPERQLQRKRR